MLQPDAGPAMFEDSTPQWGKARRSAWALAISVLLHVGAIAALVVAGARGPAGDAGERPIDILFLRAARAAPAANSANEGAAAAASPAERQAARERQAMLDRLVQPTGIPGTEPAAAAAATGIARAGAPDRPRTPDPEGAEAPGGEPALPVEAGGGIVSPVLIESSGVWPVYPEEALRAGLEGLVVLEAIVDERGRVGG